MVSQDEDEPVITPTRIPQALSCHENSQSAYDDSDLAEQEQQKKHQSPVELLCPSQASLPSAPPQRLKRTTQGDKDLGQQHRRQVAKVTVSVCRYRALRNENARLRREIRDCRMQEARATNEMEGMRGEEARLEQELDDNRRARDRDSQRIRDLEGEKEVLEQRERTTRQEMFEALSRLSSSQALERDWEGLERAKEGWHERFRQAAREQRECQEEAELMLRDLGDAREELKRASAEASMLQRRIQGLEESLEEHKGWLRELDEQVREGQDDVSEARKRAQFLENQLREVCVNGEEA